MYKNKYKILELYINDWRNRYYLREISYKTNIPLRTVQNTVSVMEKESILLHKYEGRNKYYVLNLNNIMLKYELMITEIERTKEFLERQKSFQVLLKRIKDLPPIIIFGSYARNNENKKSDVDMLIISEKEVEEISILPYNTHVININNNTFVKWFESGETLLKEVLKNHIILNHHYYFVDRFWWYYVGQG